MEDPSVMCQSVSQLFQEVSRELKQPDHVLMPHEHRNTAQVAATLPPRQLPVDPSDSEGILEANLGRLPPDREQSFVPYSPDPARLQPLWKLLGLGQVA